MQINNITYTLDRNYHGGSCCGMQHLSGFYTIPSWTDAQKKQFLQEGIDSVFDSFVEGVAWEEREYNGENVRSIWRCCIEVVLNEAQVGYWAETLEAAGFKQVFSFLNHNSGNECHVFLLETNRPK
jgi:hypothetical protein